MKRFFCVLLAGMLALALTGCGTPNRAEQQGEDTMVFTDSCGREVTLDKTITRIAPSGSAAQMILYTLCPELLVGWSASPTEGMKHYIDETYWDLPVFGQFYGQNVNLNIEALLNEKPQVIIDMGDMKSGHKEDMDGIQEQTGVPTIFIEANIDTFPQAYRTLGKLFGKEQQADAIASYIEKTVAEARSKAQTIAEEDVVSVYFGTGETGLNANAAGSIHADVIDIIGAKNAAVVEQVSNKGGGNIVNMEQLMQFDPDVMIFEHDGAYDKVGTDPLWSGLRAVQNGTYYEIPGEPYHWMASPPSVNRIIGIKWLGNLLYPRVFDHDMIEETKAFYSLFWHCELTDQQAEALLEHSTLK